MMQVYSFLHIVEREEIYIYIPSQGGYSPNGKWYIRRELYRAFAPYYDDKGKPIMNSHRVNEIQDRIKAETSHNVVIFEQKEPLFNVVNGVLDLITCNLVPHSPKYRMQKQSPVIYNKHAACPKFMDYLDKTVDKKYHAVLQEMFGYAMWYRYDAQRAFMLFGPPRTGKGT